MACNFKARNPDSPHATAKKFPLLQPGGGGGGDSGSAPKPGDSAFPPQQVHCHDNETRIKDHPYFPSRLSLGKGEANQALNAK